MAHVALLPFGSAGDVFPFIWLGRQLQARGHAVTVITACLFEEAVTGAGLAFVPIGTPEEFELLTNDPRIWKAYEGTKLVFEFAAQSAAAFLTAIEGLHGRGEKPDLLMAPMTAFGARMAREKLGIPLITVHLQPAALLSAHETPVLLPGMQHFRKLLLWLKRLILSLPNPADRFALPRLKQLFQAHGIQSPRNLFKEWWHSPDGTLLLFPEWFAAPQPDWPAARLQWDFPLEDLASENALEPDLLTFLQAGEKPVIVTAGSANVQAASFFETITQAILHLNQRAVLVTRKLEQLPANLPSSIMAVEYAPFSSLLPHASAFVHHGGIGTLSQGMAAGVPQLVMAMAHDQPDNGFRLQELSAGRMLSPRQFNKARVSSALKFLLQEPSVKVACREIQERIKQRRSFGECGQWLEARL